MSEGVRLLESGIGREEQIRDDGGGSFAGAGNEPGRVRDGKGPGDPGERRVLMQVHLRRAATRPGQDVGRQSMWIPLDHFGPAEQGDGELPQRSGFGP